MSRQSFVIIGNGPAANQAAESLRNQSDDSKITILSKDPFRGYLPHLLPDFICGSIGEESLYFKPYAYYKDRNISLRLGQKAVGVDFSKRNVVVEHRELISFDGLIIATGGKPRIPEYYQLFKDLMLTLKTPVDAKRWISKLKRVDSVLMLGGDLTSLSLTKTLLEMGKQIQFIINEDAFWPVPYGEEIYATVTERLESKDVEVVHCNKIRRVAQIDENLIEVETNTCTLRTGAIGAFFGLAPDVRFLVRSGLDIDRGILVDEFLKTRFEGVFAVGDCAQVYHPALRNYWVSIGYRNATTLGKIAASNLLGSKVEALAKPESILEVGGVKVNTSWWVEF
ncbi:MAG: FAD/NAD(P)-binding oxidoreductase [Pseudomonadota bacterium]